MPQRQIAASPIILVSWHIAYNDRLQAAAVAFANRTARLGEGTMADAVRAVSSQSGRLLAGGAIAFGGNSLTMNMALPLCGFERAKGWAARLDHAVEF